MLEQKVYIRLKTKNVNQDHQSNWHALKTAADTTEDEALLLSRLMRFLFCERETCIVHCCHHSLLYHTIEPSS